MLSVIDYPSLFLLDLEYNVLVQVAADQVDDNQKKQRLARQRRLTQSLGISCLCTIFVYMIPYGMGYFLVDVLSMRIRLWFYILSTLNPLCNVIIYYYRQSEMKQASIALFTGKVMPGTLSAWKANTQAKRNIMVRKLENKKGTDQEGNSINGPN